MNQTIQKTTQKLVDLLPDQSSYYHLDELRSLGFPSFIVERIQVELERNLAESMIPPKTDWANTESEAVNRAWQQFVEAIRAEARLPASYAQAVIETAVADVLDMVVEPRKNISDVVFGSDDTLSYEQLQRRIKAVVVYRHFATLLPRYMQKKEINTLSKERCTGLVERADEKLTANYSPLNWAQMLDPLFTLLDGKVPPSLFRLFFEDKNRSRLATAFDSVDETLNRAQFIEILSAPEVTETSDTHLKPDDVEFSAVPDQTGDQESEVPPAKEKSNLTTEPKAAKSEEPAPSEEQKEDDPVAAPSAEKPEGDQPEEASEEESFQYHRFGASSAGTAVEENEEENENSLNAVFSGQEDSEEPVSVSAPEAEPQVTTEPDAQTDWEEDEDDDPIWMRFMSEEEKAKLETEEEADEAVPFAGWGTREADVTGHQPAGTEAESPSAGRETPNAAEEERLKRQLAGQRRRYIEVIFSGKEREYDQAVSKIASFSGWNEASKYIKNDIFERNTVDMYSEVTVDFIDNLQGFFLEKEQK